VLVKVHIETSWAFEFRNVVSHANQAKIRPNFQKYSKKTKRPNNIFAAKQLLKTVKLSQFGRKKAKFPTQAKILCEILLLMN